jgi:flagellar basal-body rod protein FlgG
MNGAFYVGAIGLDAQQRALEVVANNIANINTTGFKRSAVSFSELVAPTRNGDDLPVSFGDRVSSLAGVMVTSTPHIWTEGDLKQTGRQLDIAIDGQGFLELMGQSGRTLLWRGGSLKVNEDGYLSAADGTPLQAMISVPRDATSLSIDRDGNVSAKVSGAADTEKLGRLDIAMIKDTDGLVDVGNGYYEASDPSLVYTVAPGEEGGGTFAQGALEGANVELTDEMTTLLLTQRAFAANAQVVQAGDQLMGIVNGLRR